jgi:hypothetical protein
LAGKHSHGKALKQSVYNYFSVSPFSSSIRTDCSGEAVRTWRDNGVDSVEHRCGLLSSPAHEFCRVVQMRKPSNRKSHLPKSHKEWAAALGFGPRSLLLTSRIAAFWSWDAWLAWNGVVF